MEDKFKESYRVIELEKFRGPLAIKEKKLRGLQEDEVLIKVMCGTIHPADFSFVKGTYASCKPDLLPLIPGLEGSGLIVKVGSKIDKNLIGKRCSVFTDVTKPGQFQGLWGQYHYAKLDSLLIFNKEIDYDKICYAFGNPFTSCGFVDTLRKVNANVVGQNGASSAFGKIFIRLCAKLGIKTVNIVRKAEYVEKLKSYGADYVFNSSDPNWEKEFEAVCKELNLKNFLECVGGNTTGTILKLLPPGSTIYHFGNLELKRLGNIDTSDFIFHKKLLKGWWCTEWIKSLNPEERKSWMEFIVKEFESDSDLFETTLSKKFTLEEYDKAFEYYLGHMSEGKLILMPNA
jgi:NADPH:quinone reductase-like Zn-dependent oxidoreductase